jgi:hypothetical protein
MTGVHLTPAQARRLGIGSSVSADGRRTPPTAAPAAVGGTARTTRRVAKGGPYRTVCVLCHTSFTTMAAEDRHLTATSHPRYALVLEVI